MAAALDKLPDSERYELNLSLDTYTSEESENTQARLSTMLMSGQGYDLFMNDDAPLRDYVKSGLLTDIYTLIDADTHTSRDAFYSEPLKAMEIDGGLYTFPMSFSTTHVMINADLPPTILERFQKYDHITLDDMVFLYEEIIRDYNTDFGHLKFAIGNGCIANIASDFFAQHLSDYIDFDKRTASFTDENFITFIKTYGRIYNAFPNFFNANTANTPPTPVYLNELANSYAFYVGTGSLIGVFEQFYSPFFTDGKMLTDSYGMALLDTQSQYSTWADVCIPVGEKANLAWDYVKHMAESFSNPQKNAVLSFYESYGSLDGWWGPNSMATPIIKNSFITHANNALDNVYKVMVNSGAFYRVDMQSDKFTEDDVPSREDVDEALNIITRLTEVPMTTANAALIPESLYDKNRILYEQNTLSAEELAQLMQNAVSLWLIE
jgi:hypothetical protein